MPLRSINDIARSEEWPSGRKKGQKISRSTLWSWVDQGLLKPETNHNDDRLPVMVDLDEVRRLMLLPPAQRRALRLPRPAAGRHVRLRVLGRREADEDAGNGDGPDASSSGAGTGSQAPTQP
jgi:hypothetical protein